MIQIIKLKYPSSLEGYMDLIIKEITDEYMNYSLPIHSVIHLGDGKFDLMIEGGDYYFEGFQIFPESPDHTFAGW